MPSERPYGAFGLDETRACTFEKSKELKKKGRQGLYCLRHYALLVLVMGDEARRTTKSQDHRHEHVFPTSRKGRHLDVQALCNSATY